MEAQRVMFHMELAAGPPLPRSSPELGDSARYAEPGKRTCSHRLGIFAKKKTGHDLELGLTTVFLGCDIR